MQDELKCDVGGSQELNEKTRDDEVVYDEVQCNTNARHPVETKIEANYKA